MRKDISQIILVGGSTKLPMIKSFLNDFFIDSKINDSINPDEVVAYGATLMAAKILLESDNLLSGFTYLDITPLSLGIEVSNESEDEEIQKEVGIMSIIINRGSKIPLYKKIDYIIPSGKKIKDNITIYEGEEKYIKNNNILGKIILSGLSNKAYEKVMISVQLFIDVNGILTVSAEQSDENGNKKSVEATNIVSLTKEQIALLKKKNKKYLYNSKSTLDSTSLRESLNYLEDGLNYCKNDEEKLDILITYNDILEKFLDSFDKNFDNEITVEKYYLYIKELFTFYSKTLKLQESIKNNEENVEIQKNIINKTLKYIDLFINKNYVHLNNLVQAIKDFQKNIFYKIVVDIIEKLNNHGKEYIIDIQNYSKYNSLIYFKKAKFYYDNYISRLNNLNEF